MIKQHPTSQKIVIIGPKTAIGQCVLGQLAQNNIPVTRIRPLDIHQEAGKTLYYDNHKLFTQPLDLFDFNANHIVFVCDKKILPLLHHRQLRSSDWWIDCTHSVKEALCIIPSINGFILKKYHPKWVCNPTSTVITLVNILTPILKTFHTKSIQLNLLMGTIFQGHETSEKLMIQIRHFLTKTPLPESSRYPQLAFNVIPNYFNDLAQIIKRQMHCFIEPNTIVQTCFVPVIRGVCIHVQLFLQKNYNPARLLKKLNTLPDIQLISDNYPIGLNDIITENNVFIIHPIVHNKILSFWCLQDVVQKGIGTNAAQLAQLLTK